jgi:hypothetical protein
MSTSMSSGPSIARTREMSEEAFPKLLGLGARKQIAGNRVLSVYGPLVPQPRLPDSIVVTRAHAGYGIVRCPQKLATAAVSLGHVSKMGRSRAISSACLKFGRR